MASGNVRAEPDRLAHGEELFALEYLSNGGNATAAYQATHPKAKATTAASNGYRLLRKAEIAAFIDKERCERFRRLQMDGDEALARVAGDARADIRMLFDADGKLLNPHDWPDEIANSIEGVELRADGALRVRLASKSAARRTILEQTGKLKSTAGAVDELAAAMRADLERNKALVGK